MGDGPEQTNEDLVRAVRAGDAAAARRLFDRHREALRGRVRRGLPTGIRAKVAESDVIQEAWLAAFLSLGDFEDRGDGSFGRWLRGILDRRIARELRRHHGVAKRDARREVRMATSADAGLPAVGERSPSGVAMDTEQVEALRAAIDTLSADHAEIVRLVHFDGLTLVAAGAAMGRSEDAARKLYGRAIAGLATRLRRAARAAT